ncbi:MAG TPA: hypothetical protein DEP45_06720 [Armatimonadetes bacterium]|nr:hypothetical protein [Armatimonadota bacterium]
MRTPQSIGFVPGQMGVLKFMAHLPNFIKLYTRLFADKRVSSFAKGILLAGIGYLIVPVDAIADIMVPLGFADDISVLAGALWLFVRLCPRRVVEEHVEIIDAGG